MREKRVAKELQKVSPTLTLLLCLDSRAHSLGKINTHGLPPGIELVDGDNLKLWFLDIRVLDKNPLYEGHIYRLKFCFPEAYPIGMITSFGSQLYSSCQVY